MNDLFTCPLPISKHDRVQLGHGSGGQMTNSLIRQIFLKTFNHPALLAMDDFALLDVPAGRLSVSTDSFVVDPIFFPGGDIGELAVHGTINDVAMSGARPLYLSAAFILEEGFPLKDLERVVVSMGRAAAAAGVPIVTGDTKVVNKGKGDKIFINTTGIGVLEKGMAASASRLAAADKIILNGPIADHGMAILSKREGLEFELPIESDTAALHTLIADVVSAGGDQVHAMRDATRGGLGAVCNELAESSAVGIMLQESAIPVRAPVAAACEIMGLDPLFVANEGKMVVVVAAEKAEVVLRAMRNHPLGQQAVIIGEVIAESPGLVQMRTSIGGKRIVDPPVGEQLPRIC